MQEGFLLLLSPPKAHVRMNVPAQLGFRSRRAVYVFHEDQRLGDKTPDLKQCGSQLPACVTFPPLCHS